METIIGIIVGIITLIGAFFLGKISKKEYPEMKYDDKIKGFRKVVRDIQERADRKTTESVKEIKEKTNEQIIHDFNDAFTNGPVTGTGKGTGDKPTNGR